MLSYQGVIRMLPHQEVIKILSHQGVGGRWRASAGRTEAGRRWFSHVHDDHDDDHDDYSDDDDDLGDDDGAGKLVAGDFLRFGSKFILSILRSFSQFSNHSHHYDHNIHPYHHQQDLGAPYFSFPPWSLKHCSHPNLYISSSQFLITGATELPWTWWSSSGGLTSPFLSWKAICLWQF